jgi:hypothetical protein
MPRKVQRKQDIFQRTRKTWVENSEICKAPATTGASFNKSKARRENGPFFRFCANDRKFWPSKEFRDVVS